MMWISRKQQFWQEVGDSIGLEVATRIRKDIPHMSEAIKVSSRYSVFKAVLEDNWVLVKTRNEKNVLRKDDGWEEYLTDQGLRGRGKERDGSD